MSDQETSFGLEVTDEWNGGVVTIHEGSSWLVPIALVGEVDVGAVYEAVRAAGGDPGTVRGPYWFAPTSLGWQQLAPHLVFQHAPRVLQAYHVTN